MGFTLSERNCLFRSVEGVISKKLFIIEDLRFVDFRSKEAVVYMFTVIC